MIRKNYFAALSGYYRFFALLIISPALFLLGCSGSGAPPAGPNGTGTFRLVVDAGRGMASMDIPSESRIIPSASETIAVEISGTGINSDSPFTTSAILNDGEAVLLAEDIPAGTKTALIKALDSDDKPDLASLSYLDFNLCVNFGR